MLLGSVLYVGFQSELLWGGKYSVNFLKRQCLGHVGARNNLKHFLPSQLQLNVAE